VSLLWLLTVFRFTAPAPPRVIAAFNNDNPHEFPKSYPSYFEGTDRT
jgi:hypothetical protein